ncbi:MAG TPA: hypothetical protein VN734_17350 [Acidobacteriaceae bacterium]|nr:hypothetical protein [Acidobacteriaceae bacterium]
MIGNGSINLRQEVLKQALQEWLDRRWTADSPVVTGVLVNPYNTTMTMTGEPLEFTVRIQSNKTFLGAREDT